ncbi:MAG: A/G-specific adenine glycosylase [Sphingobacteriales bacterium]|jgi:A/G-specific adenine glycosylase
MNFSDRLIAWYKQNGRDLPWRQTSNPYPIYLSEIIMQQTRVEQGLPYYNKFLKNFPTVADLARADEDEILKNWQGLGYYSRARNMHKAMRIIHHDLDGKFPNNYQDLIKLPGVGDYSASAISSFAFKEVKAVVDGNVYRFLSRFFGESAPIDTGKGQKIFKELATELISPEEPDSFNQGIMEFGATICKPKNPNCTDCIFNRECKAFADENVFDFPVKSRKTKIRTRYFNYLICTFKDTTYLLKRGEKDIWQGLFDFPMIETSNLQDWTNLAQDPQAPYLTKSNVIKAPRLTEEIKHILSHQVIIARFWEVELNNYLDSNLLEIKSKDIHKFASSRLLEKYLEKHSLKS